MESQEGAFQQYLNELKELNAITMESIGYGTSNITEQMVAPDAAMTLDNLASMAMSKTDALDTLVVVNKQLANALAHVTKENEKLLKMVSQLTNDAIKPKQCKQGTPNNYCWTHSFIMSANDMRKGATTKHLATK